MLASRGYGERRKFSRSCSLTADVPEYSISVTKESDDA
jgi:hypothetical protein